MTPKNPPLLMAFYGDDFTGSTDALESLSLAGAKTVLFIEPPTAEQLERFEGLQAIGVAGMTRALAPEEMEKELRLAFTALQLLGAQHLHYKVCSTFDSSPAIGSIGRAIDTGAEIFPAPFVPLLVAAPSLGRYCVFGNLFARMGIGSQGSIFRLDRHPSMSTHPVTPADESDLRLHLAKQTNKQIGLVDILQIRLPAGELRRVVDTLVNSENEIVLFDALYEENMEGIGQLIHSYAERGNTLFSVGSSGIGAALGSFWQKLGLLKKAEEWPDAGPAEVLLVVSGSCSPVTSAQIRWSVANGFAEIGLDTVAIAQAEDIPAFIAGTISAAIAMVKKGQSVIVHTNAPGENVQIEKSSEAPLFISKKNRKSSTAEIFGNALGLIAKGVAAQTSLTRIVISGGDTSSFAARAMGIEAVEMIGPLSPGAPLCKAHAPHSPIDGLEVNFKGGQVGREDYFGMVKQGRFVP